MRGFEDSRLFKWNGALWTLSTVRELTPEGWCEQVLAPISAAGYGPGWSVIHPAERHHEKNWMPWAQDGEELMLVYWLGTVLDPDGKVLHQHHPKFIVNNISGGSQVIDAGGVWLALVHEARHMPGRETRFYQHRFVELGSKGEVVGISAPFVFHDKQIEFAAGLAYFPETRTLMASYGVRDREAWIAEMDLDEVMDFIRRGHTA